MRWKRHGGEGYGRLRLKDGENNTHHAFDFDPSAVEVRDRTGETVHLGE